MSDRTPPYNDVIRRQQERDLGHPLDHGKDKQGATPAELGKPWKQPKHDRIDVDDEGLTDTGRRLDQEE